MNILGSRSGLINEDASSDQNTEVPAGYQSATAWSACFPWACPKQCYGWWEKFGVNTFGAFYRTQAHINPYFISPVTHRATSQGMVFFLQVISKHLTGHRAALVVSGASARLPLAGTQAGSSCGTVSLSSHWAGVCVIAWQNWLQFASLRKGAALRHNLLQMTVYTLAFTWKTVSEPGREKSCASICFRRLSLEQHLTLDPSLCLAQADNFQFSAIQHRAEPHSMGHNFIWEFLRLQSWSWDTIYQMSQHPESSVRVWRKL